MPAFVAGWVQLPLLSQTSWVQTFPSLEQVFPLVLRVQLAAWVEVLVAQVPALQA